MQALLQAFFDKSEKWTKKQAFTNLIELRIKVLWKPFSKRRRVNDDGSPEAFRIGYRIDKERSAGTENVFWNNPLKWLEKKRANR